MISLGDSLDTSLDVVVIGAGVVGLAIARALALASREVLVIEQHDRVGEETSSRNSEVIHGGFHYPPDSLKAQLCVRGKELLYRYCQEKSIEHRRCGKLTVALNEAQHADLEALNVQGIASGVDDLTLLDQAQAAELEPAVRCTSALLSPSTGIIDSHGLMMALQGDLEAAGGTVSVRSEFVRGCVEREGFSLRIRSVGESVDVSARAVVNCAGLSAALVAGGIAGLDPQHVPRVRYAKGNYFVYRGKHPFRRLVYPLPEPGGLGVHVTLDLFGTARFGPNVQWVDAPEYSVDVALRDAFAEAIKAYWPHVAPDRLAPGYAGVRPKLIRPGDPPGDFVIQGPDAHGVPGLVNLYGIESPGLTSSLAIGERVAGILATVQSGP